MEEPIVTKIELPNAVMKSPSAIGPPPAKKLKQARLPFALKQITSPTTSASKKRKLSDSAKLDKQPTKQAKSEDSTVIVIDDNEVSSSSEAEANKNKEVKNEKPKVKTIKDMFAGLAQQSEVSTSSIDPEPKQLKGKKEHKGETPVKAQKVDKGKTPVKESTEEKKAKSSGDTSGSKENGTEESIKESSSKSSDSEGKSENESSSDSEDDKENDVSMLSEAGDTSVIDGTDADDESGMEADTSIMENSDAVDKDGKPTSVGATPTGASKPKKKSVMSEKKKAEREAAKQRKKEELEKLKAEKERQKEERLQQKKLEKAQKEQEKEQLKEQKMKEREEKQKEKEMKNKLKEEEKKKKQEALEAKMEEKKKKDEERKKKEEEKKQAEEEQNMKKQKVQKAFVSFFKKVDKPAAAPKASQKTSSLFMEFEPKKDMKLAPSVRTKLQDTDKAQLDEFFQKQTSEDLYVKQLREKTITPKHSGKTWPWATDDLEIVEEGNTGKPERMKAKLLQFHENYRPPYYGTWRKKSEKITPRRPLAQDTSHLDYEVDSDDEWEEEEPGESLSHSEGEDEEEPKEADADADDDDEDDDGFFVPHGYLSEGEGCEDDDDDCTPERMKARQLAKAKAFEAEMKQRCEAMRAFFIGCLWWTPEGLAGDPNYNKLREFAAVSLLASRGPIPVQSTRGPAAALDNSPAKTKTPKTKTPKTKTPKEGGDGVKGAKIMPVPDEAMPELIRLVHGNQASIQKLVKEFREYWCRKMGSQDSNETTSVADTSMDLDSTAEGSSCTTPGTPAKRAGTISKRQLNIVIRSIANYTKKEGFDKCCWYVRDEVLQKQSMVDLPVPTRWQWVTRPNKENSEEPMTPKATSGRETPTPAATPTSITKFTVPKSQLPTPEPSTPSTPSSHTPTTTTTPKAADKHPPKNLMSIKSAFAAIPKSKQSSGSKSQAGTKTCDKSTENTVNGADKRDTSQDDDDECMIVDETPTLPIKPGKGQPTLLSMLKTS